MNYYHSTLTTLNNVVLELLLVPLYMNYYGNTSTTPSNIVLKL